MLEKGFLPEVRKIAFHPTMPNKNSRLSLMFSATFSEDLRLLAEEFLKDDYIFLTLGKRGTVNADIKQEFVEIIKTDKKKALLEQLKQSDVNDLIIIFVEERKTADFVAAYLCQCDFKATSIHGARFQEQRERALMDFRTAKMSILVATSVAARGLDIKNLRLVINYDLPKDIETYIHRVGRTGRIGNSGKAISFFDPSTDIPLSKDLVAALTKADRVIPAWLIEYAKKGKLDKGEVRPNALFAVCFEDR